MPFPPPFFLSENFLHSWCFVFIECKNSVNDHWEFAWNFTIFCYYFCWFVKLYFVFLVSFLGDFSQKIVIYKQAECMYELPFSFFFFFSLFFFFFSFFSLFFFSLFLKLKASGLDSGRDSDTGWSLADHQEWWTLSWRINVGVAPRNFAILPPPPKWVRTPWPTQYMIFIFYRHTTTGSFQEIYGYTKVVLISMREDVLMSKPHR